MLRPQSSEIRIIRAFCLTVRVSEPLSKRLGSAQLSKLLGNMTSSNSDQRLEHLLSAVESEFQKGSEKGDASERDIKLSLDDADLWIKFKELTNEMIVTKTGR